MIVDDLIEELCKSISPESEIVINFNNQPLSIKEVKIDEIGSVEIIVENT